MSVCRPSLTLPFPDLNRGTVSKQRQPLWGILIYLTILTILTSLPCSPCAPRGCRWSGMLAGMLKSRRDVKMPGRPPWALGPSLPAPTTHERSL